MERKLAAGLLVAAAIAVSLIAAYSLAQRAEQPSSGKMEVVVTIPPQKEFVERVGGERVTVTVMVPPGADPHTYEPTPSQLQRVSRAKVYFMVGSGVEFELAWMGRMASLNENMLIVDCSEGVDRIDGDPHIWLSPRNAKIMVNNIFAGLVRADPAGSEYFERNRENYLLELDGLDREIAGALSGLQSRKMLVYHPAWAYFCRDYGLEQVSIEEGGKEPSPQDVARIIELAKRENIKVVFASPQFSTQSARAIAEEIGGRVVLVDPLAENYLQNMREVARAFAGVAG